MDSKYNNLINSTISGLDFKKSDFTKSRSNGKKAQCISSVIEIQEILTIYCKNSLGENNRKKSTDRKVAYIETTLTKSGLEKVYKAKTILRKIIIEDAKLKERKTKPVPIWESDCVRNMASLCEDSGDFRSTQEEYIMKMHHWGKYDESDRRFYLHMVFRYYLNEYHKEAKQSKKVIEFPSYQYILDRLEPNGCKTGFPPEFIKFMNESSGRTFRVSSLPVPTKGCGKSVNYDVNFENIPEVSTFRRMIYANFLRWRDELNNRNHCIYPKYLTTGDPGNSVIREEVTRARAIQNIRNDIYRLERFDTEKMKTIVEKRPEIEKLHEKYSHRVFRTSGEQLEERMGFFLFSRSHFFSLEEHDFVEEFFKQDDARMEMYVHLKNFCTPKKVLSNLEKDDTVLRNMIVLLSDVIYLFHLFCNREKCEEDPTNIVRTCVESLSK